jgi:protein TonB
MKKTFFIFILGIFSFIPMQAQVDSISNGIGIDDIITSPEKTPEFPGGQQALNDFIRKNIRYPMPAKENGISGKVYASFIVNTDGSVGEIKIVKGIGGGCDEEVVRVLRLMPNWTPGEVSGRAVRVKYMLPVAFTLK